MCEHNVDKFFIITNVRSLIFPDDFIFIIIVLDCFHPSPPKKRLTEKQDIIIDYTCTHGVQARVNSVLDSTVLLTTTVPVIVSQQSSSHGLTSASRELTFIPKMRNAKAFLLHKFVLDFVFKVTAGHLWVWKILS